LGDRQVPGGGHERRERAVRDRVRVDREPLDLHLAHGRLLRIVRVGAHPEAAARQLDHRPDVIAASSFATTWSIVKLAAFWRGGNSATVARNCVTSHVAASTM